MSFATKPDGNAFGNLFFASEAPGKGISSLSPDNVFAAEVWGEGTASSSDVQCFRAAGRGEAAGQVNVDYGGDPGILFYTHESDQYAPFLIQVVNATVRDATYVLDGLLYHESDLRIEAEP